MRLRFASVDTKGIAARYQLAARLSKVDFFRPTSGVHRQFLVIRGLEGSNEPGKAAGLSAWQGVLFFKIHNLDTFLPESDVDVTSRNQCS